MGHRYKNILLIFTCLFLCGNATSTYHSTSYWVWAGVPFNRVPKLGSSVYVFQGQILDKAGQIYFAKQGLSSFNTGLRELYLVFRLSSLKHIDALNNLLEFAIHSWEKHGNIVKGVQLDFDSSTPNLNKYGDFLKRVRGLLPRNYQLSITGLGDWVRSKESTDKWFFGSVDEVIFQLYQGRKSISDREYYIGKMATLKTPFKVGILESDPLSPNEEKFLKNCSQYRGIVLFLNAK